jgi:hypothetical protein
MHQRRMAFSLAGLLVVFGSKALWAGGSPLSGHADIAWLPQSGPVYIWMNNGKLPLAVGFLNTNVPSGWAPTGTADASWVFGSAAILFFNQGTLQVSSWSFDTSGVVTSHLVQMTAHDDTWKPVGPVQFRGLTPAEFPNPQYGILWNDQENAELSVWYLAPNGTTVTSNPLVATNSACDKTCRNPWKVKLAADFNGDGNSDILWYNQTSGQVWVWLLDQRANVSGSYVLTLTSSGGSASWDIVGADDIDGDGRADLLWYNKTLGQLSNWLLNGAQVTAHPILSATCSAGGCAGGIPIGYVGFPSPPSPLSPLGI